MLPPALAVTQDAARRFHRRAVGLDVAMPDVAAALARLGYVQIDPVNVCGRMHDLILRNRVRGYRQGDLMRHLHGDGDPLAPTQRRALEHHLPSTSILAAFPLDAWPHLLTAMRTRARERGAWSGRLTPREQELAKRILGEMAERGPLTSEHVADERRGRRVWGSATLAKTVLQKLFFHGRVLIARREQNRRVYDLPERVLPPEVLALPAPPASDTDRWLVLTKLRQRRLAWLTRDELPRVEDLVQPVSVPGVPLLYCLREDVALLETVCAGGGTPGKAGNAAAPEAAPLLLTARETEDGAAPGAAPLRRAARAGDQDDVTVPLRREAMASELKLLAPLDPLIYDRRVTRTLWSFDYVWEVYTPPHKRLRGHYSLPVLAGTELVGHVDPKAERASGRLLLTGKKVRRGYPVSAALRELAAFLGLRRQ